MLAMPSKCGAERGDPKWRGGWGNSKWCSEARSWSTEALDQGLRHTQKEKAPLYALKYST